ncbi:MAG: MBL fold metallo-hydrolase [Desulfobacterota bacterium]|jgi:glyoxylase-like metal-dependent hydrolase (beta-lactamase superfamily II)|nr:MBL fold metallo-hydrolase [Thermodesulfobacteriota bacterium]
MEPELIEIKQDRPGFERFIGSWLCVSDRTVVVDVGPSRSLPKLIASLTAKGVHRVDYVLLTHIHVDHAGGLAEFLDHFSTARAVCHSKAIPHLVDPSKLWLGSQKTLGDLAAVYGPIRPVKQERLIPHTEAHAEGIELIETPGHAVHHLSFILEGNLFAGEAGGVHFRGEEREYLRPATPPVFFLKQFVESIDRLLAARDLPMCYAHFGRAESSHRVLKRERAQLLFWERIIREETAVSDPDLPERCMTRLLAEDPELSAFKALSPAEQEREKFFMGNSIKGYLGFLQAGHP